MVRLDTTSSSCLAALLVTSLIPTSHCVCPTIAHCQTCPDEAVCNQCDAQWALFNFEGESKCVQDCNAQSSISAAYFTESAIDGTLNCRQCHSSCAGCFGVTSSDCLKCQADAGFLHEQSCIATCPLNTYPSGTPADALGRRCLPCRTGCALCSEDTDCQVCAKDYSMHNDTTCQASCPAFEGPVRVSGNDGYGSVCEACADATFCEKCTDDGAASCVVCSGSRVVEEGVCVANCSSNYFLDNGTCITCASRFPGCGSCGAAGTNCTECETGFYQAVPLGDCLEKTQCRAWEYASTSGSTTSDRSCTTCGVCNPGTFSTIPCGGDNSGSCSACLSAADCTAAGSDFVGTCTPDHSPSCRPAQPADAAPTGRHLIMTQVTVADIQDSAASSATASSIETALAVGSALNAYALRVFEVNIVTSVSLTFYARVMPTVDDTTTAQAAFEDRLRNEQSAWLASLGSSFNSATVTVGAIVSLPAKAAPKSITTLSLTSNKTSILWGAPDLTVDLESYEVRVTHGDSGEVLRYDLTATSTLEFLFWQGPGDYIVDVAAVYSSSAREPGRSPSISTTLTAPSCSSNCAECSSSTSCLVCATSTDELEDGACISAASTATTSSSCSIFGMCDTTGILVVLAIAVGGLVLLLLLYCCCTRKKIAAKQFEEALKLKSVKDVRFVPRWTQQGDRYRRKLAQTKPLTHPMLEAKAHDRQALTLEFDSVPPNAAFPDEVPSNVEDLNRNMQILPNVHSRVYLAVDRFSSDRTREEYINANYVRSFHDEEQVFVVTEAPSPVSTEAFWRMVWQTKATIVVQLNGLVEGGKIVGSRYWPTKGQWHQIAAHTNKGPSRKKTSVLRVGDFKIKLVKETSSESVTTTLLKVWYGPLGPRRIEHIWLTQCGNYEQPNNVALWNAVVQQLRMQRTKGVPVILHDCSGVERSCVFAALDAVQQEIDVDGQADLLGALCRVRQDRGQAISTEAQYEFLHKAALQYMRKMSGPGASKRRSGIVSNPAFSPGPAMAMAQDNDSLLGDDESANYRRAPQRGTGPAMASPATAAEAEWSLSDDSEDDGEPHISAHESNMEAEMAVMMDNTSMMLDDLSQDTSGDESAQIGRSAANSLLADGVDGNANKALAAAAQKMEPIYRSLDTRMRAAVLLQAQRADDGDTADRSEGEPTALAQAMHSEQDYVNSSAQQEVYEPLPSHIPVVMGTLVGGYASDTETDSDSDTSDASD